MKKILTTLGDADRVDEILKQVDDEAAARFIQTEQEETGGAIE